MSIHKLQVQRFYRDLWENCDKAGIPEVLHSDFTFRGSLGYEKRGHGGFADYVDMVHRALSNYRCFINDLVVEPPKVFARMTFQGTHMNEFRGFEGTGKTISWDGAALFTFEGDKIWDVWVLGDLFNLEATLKRNET
tara:strand:+ start:256 stop:666 length:411 start_codon:yes stop_codon:yes gene_type:complete